MSRKATRQQATGNKCRAGAPPLVPLCLDASLPSRKLLIGRVGRREFRLPLEVQTQTIAILGNRGSGKTHTGAVMIEEQLRRGQPLVIIDPTDVWWGLKAARDGKQTGYPITVLGGPHGDLPLQESDGAILADFAVEQSAALVLSLRHLRKGAQKRFVTDFAEQLYHRKGELEHRTPLQVVIDECDAFIPQRVGGAEARMVGAIEDLVRRGRAAGIGVCLISQRAASVNKDVLTQIELLIAHRHTSPHDRKALDAWVQAHDTHGCRDKFMGELAGLPIGTAYFWSPGWLDIFERVAVGRRRTFDSSATPKAGQRVVKPRRLAQADLEQLKRRLAATVDQAAANDPKTLRRRIAELQNEPRRQKKPTIDQEALERAARQARQAERRFWVERLHLLPRQLDMLGQLAKSICKDVTVPTEIEAQTYETRHQDNESLQRKRRPPTLETEKRKQESGFPISTSNNNGPLGGGALRMARVLADRHPARFTEAQWATLSELKRTGGTWGTYKSRLRQAGLVESDGRYWWASAQALAEHGDPSRCPQTSAEIQQAWKSRLGGGAARMIDALVERWPSGITRDELGRAVGISAAGGTFGTYLSRLRSNGLLSVENGELRAARVLVEG
ncbi:MAG: DUF853 family protein [Phycisphaerae bacterium]|nr:DUF853 family protein [Phycisphaerae bacterium]